MARKRVFILGSCVSRDMIQYFPGEFAFTDYFARTSIASIGLPAVVDREARAAIASLSSAFQRRMLDNDFDKTTLRRIAGAEHDILLLDLIDERFSLVRAKGAGLSRLVPSRRSWFTFSDELKNGGFQPGNRQVLAPDADEFLPLWTAGFEKLLASVDRDKVVLNRTFWAERFVDGTEPAKREWIEKNKGWIRRNNALLQRLYDTIEARWSLKTIHYAPELLVADPGHRWGTAPYHYATPFYRHTADALHALFGR